MKHRIESFSRTVLLAIAVPAVVGSCALAQTANTIFGLGNATPGTIPRITPGGVVTLFVQGVGGKLTAPVRAQGFPLPTTLAGISVALQQSIGPSGDPATLAVPILAVNPISGCATGSVASVQPCSSYAGITVQIPFEVRLAGGESPPGVTRLVVSENGAGGGAMEASPYPDQVHLLQVTHADGSAVYPSNPAKSGEELILWSFALGATTPAVPTGVPSPTSVPTAQALQMNFDYRPNAAPYRPYCPNPTTCPQMHPLFSGLTQGYAGLYQVNFIVPPTPAGTPSCNDNTVNPGNPASVASNLTVSVVASTSFDGLGICVDTASAQN